MGRILVLNGPNLNLLGTREPAKYGHTSLADVVTSLQQRAQQLGHELIHQQTNAEHEMLEFVQQAPQQKIDFIIINPAAWAHTSIALRDAFAAINIPFIEVHISNIHRRESFRHHSYLIELAESGIYGCGVYGYQLALQAADNFLSTKS